MHTHTRERVSASARAHNYVCSGMCELWARSSFQAHPGTPPVRGGATRDRYPSVCIRKACCLTLDSIHSRIISLTTAWGKSRSVGKVTLNRSRRAVSFSVGRTEQRAGALAARGFASSVYFVATDIDYCKPNLVARSLYFFLSLFPSSPSIDTVPPPSPPEGGTRRQLTIPPISFRNSRSRFPPCQTLVVESFPRLSVVCLRLSSVYLAISFPRLAHSAGFDLDPTVKIRSIDEATLILDRLTPPDVPICSLFPLDIYLPAPPLFSIYISSIYFFIPAPLLRFSEFSYHAREYDKIPNVKSRSRLKLGRNISSIGEDGGPRESVRWRVRERER